MCVMPIDAVQQLMARKRAVAARTSADPTLARRLHELRAWQAARLSRTYADLGGEPEYAAAVQFFLSDLYGPQDLGRRDSDLERAWRHFKRALPAAALAILERAVSLDVLSAELDQAMAEVLPAGVADPCPVTADSYAAAYRRVGRQDDRRRQIDLIIAVGEDLDRIVRRPLIGLALRAAHVPAHAAGFGALQDFLERGFAAFRRMPGAARLLAAIRERETQLMQALLDGRAPESHEPTGGANPA